MELYFFTSLLNNLLTLYGLYLCCQGWYKSHVLQNATPIIDLVIAHILENFLCMNFQNLLLCYLFKCKIQYISSYSIFILHALSSWWCWFFINAKQTEKLCSYFSSPISKLAMNLGLVELHFVWPNLAIQTNCLVSQKHSFIFFLIFMNLFCLFTLFLD